MKPKTLLLLEAGIGVAAVALVLALNSANATAEDLKPAGEAPASNQSPAAPVGQAVEPPPAVPALIPPPLKLSPGMEEVVQLARSGVGEEVIAAFIEKSGKTYHPTAEEIIYLKDLGVAPTAIAKLIRTGNGDSEMAKPEVLYQGIAARSFERRFQLADHVHVTGASLENGLLHVDLTRELPEAQKPRQIPIGTNGANPAIATPRAA